MGGAEDGSERHQKEVFDSFVRDPQQHPLPRARRWPPEGLLFVRTVQVRHAPVRRREPKRKDGPVNVSTQMNFGESPSQ